MSAHPNDGGPVYPQRVQTGMIYQDHPGMSLRDWFAGQCLRDTFAALAAHGWENFNDYQVKRCAEASYRAADAMLAARGEK